MTDPGKTIHTTVTEKGNETTIISTTTSISTTSVISTTTASPTALIELIAYERANCGVAPVGQNGNAPNYQDIRVEYDPVSRNSACYKINQQSPQSFSWDFDPTDNFPGTCYLYFYSGGSCYDDGNTQPFNLNNGKDSCHNLSSTGQSVRLFC